MNRRKANVEQRRRDICDAAVQLLSTDGARGVTHLRVDRHAGFPDGTTSFYYQTRAALLRAAAERVIELDVADFSGALATGTAADDPLSRLASQAMRTALEPERSRARARFELMMIATREPEVGEVLDGLMDRFVALSEAAVAQMQPSGTVSDPELITAQAFAVVTFLGGFLFRLAFDLADVGDAASLERYLRALVAGVAADHVRAQAD